MAPLVTRPAVTWAAPRTNRQRCGRWDCAFVNETANNYAEEGSQTPWDESAGGVLGSTGWTDRDGHRQGHRMSIGG
ncbi:hypothetical protein PC117_g4352 [Phytophthora cactorum]|uniref:Uncharacterized protein n=1 Tax=Phytophthora cactorum TaxID=29920 RepID=A0A8T1EGL1_9STRA|nr:hypothetical protein PC117_g4352 [Phytophthora cactorum]